MIDIVFCGGRKMNILLIATGLAVVFASPVHAATLSGDEIRDKIIGKRLDWVGDNGWKGKVRHRKNGKSSLTVVSPDRIKDKGTWRIKGNQLCSTWTNIRDGQEGCTSVKTTADKRIYRYNTGVFKLRAF